MLSPVGNSPHRRNLASSHTYLMLTGSEPHSVTFDLAIRRLGITLLLAIVLAALPLLVVPEYLVAPEYLFVPLLVILWLALFFTWPNLSRRLVLKAPTPAPRGAVSPVAARLVITGLLAPILAVVVARPFDADIGGALFIPCWLALFCGWHYLARRLPALDFAKAQPSVPLGPKRPLWVRVIRGTLGTFKSVATAALTFLLLLSPALVPISLSFYRARRAHDAIHIGMSVPEVLHAASNSDLFRASSEFPQDDKADVADIPAMNLEREKDSTYRVYDMTARQNIRLSESEAIERLHAKLHDGYPWHFYYTYTNLTSTDVYFSVVFGPNGRVTEVEPIRGLD